MTSDQKADFVSRFTHLLRVYDDIADMPYVNTADKLIAAHEMLHKFQGDLGKLVDEVLFARAEELGLRVLYQSATPYAIVKPKTPEPTKDNP